MSSASHTVPDVTEFLATRFDDVSSVAPLGAGEWSQAFSFRADARRLVVRFGAHLEDYRKDEVATRYAGPNLPIPEVIETGEAFDAYYAISEWLPGKPLDHLDAAGLEAALPSILRFLDALRTADISGTRGYGMWSPAGVAPFQSWREFLLAVGDDSLYPRIRGWRAALVGRPLDLATFEEGYRHLEALAGSMPEFRHLLHTDIVGDNVRIEGGQVSAVVDWANAMYGDFLYDLARLTFWVPWYPAWAAVDIVGAAQAHYRAIGLEVPAFEERLRACQIHIGLDAQGYNVYTERWDELARSGRRTLELAQP